MLSTAPHTSEHHSPLATATPTILSVTAPILHHASHGVHGLGVASGVISSHHGTSHHNSVQAMNQLGTVYATKRRRRNGKSMKPPPKDGVTKSNPSKRHRERLNAELDTLASLLPFEQNILSKLDRLSILRLSVSYLRTKSYFQVVMHKDKDDGSIHRSRDLTAFDHTVLDGEMFLQALNGFLIILTCDGEVFFATHSIEGYLGFHQSDIVHQSVYELVHSEDREELQRQLMWNSFIPSDQAGITLQDAIQTDAVHVLERSFTVRFRCLLDNTSGFLRLDIRGRIKILHGQNRKSEEPPLALFAICTPFGPPSLLEIPQKEVMFKSKHKLDLSLVSMDQRGKMLLGYSDAELATLGGYDLVHFDDLAYVASAHQELLKTGASGMIAYRLQTKEGMWQWLQTSSRLVYKNSKPDFVISTHRPLMEEEGRDLLGKRTMDFKVSYLDAGLTNSYFTDQDQIISTNHTPTPTTPSSPRVNRRYKTQLRDFLSTCRTKRKLSSSAPNPVTGVAGVAGVGVGVPAPLPNPIPTAPMDYLSPDAAAAAYNMYGSYGTSPADHGLAYSANFQHGLYPTDNRYLATTENLFHQYRPLPSYYPEYHTGQYNGFLDMQSRGGACAGVPTYDTSASHHGPYPIASRSMPLEEKLYSCQVADTANKYTPYVDSSRGYVVANNKCLDVASWPYSVSPSSGIIQPIQVMSHDPELAHKKYHKTSPHSGSSSNLDSTHNDTVESPGSRMDDHKSAEHIVVSSPHHSLQSNMSQGGHYSPQNHERSIDGGLMPRQTVLMWSSGSSNHNMHHSSSNSSTSRSPPSQPHTPLQNHMKGLSGGVVLNNNSLHNAHHEAVWPMVGDIKPEPPQAIMQSDISPGSATSPDTLHNTQHTQHQSGRVVMVL